MAHLVSAEEFHFLEVRDLDSIYVGGLWYPTRVGRPLEEVSYLKFHLGEFWFGDGNKIHFAGKLARETNSSDITNACICYIGQRIKGKVVKTTECNEQPDKNGLFVLEMAINERSVIIFQDLKEKDFLIFEIGKLVNVYKVKKKGIPIEKVPAQDEIYATFLGKSPNDSHISAIQASIGAGVRLNVSGKKNYRIVSFGLTILNSEGIRIDSMNNFYGGLLTQRMKEALQNLEKDQVIILSNIVAQKGNKFYSIDSLSFKVE